MALLRRVAMVYIKHPSLSVAPVCACCRKSCKRPGWSSSIISALPSVDSHSPCPAPSIPCLALSCLLEGKKMLGERSAITFGRTWKRQRCSISVLGARVKIGYSWTFPFVFTRSTFGVTSRSDREVVGRRLPPRAVASLLCFALSVSFEFSLFASAHALSSS